MGKLFGNGINQGDLVDLIVAIRASITGIQTKLDSDGGVADTDYHTGATLALAALPAGFQTTGVKAIHNQGILASILDDLIAKWNATLTKLDADGQVTDVNFNSLHAITDVVGNTKLDGIIDAGQYQSCIINLLDLFITKINAVTAKLDADAGVSDTNYAALWAITDTVDEVGTKQRIKIGITSWIIGVLTAGALLCGPRPAYAGAGVEANIIGTTVTYNVFPVVDVGSLDRFSMQAAYSNGTPGAVNVTDGAKSIDKLTVTSTLTLTGTQGFNSLTVASNTALTGQSFTLNGYVFAAGTAFSIAAFSSTTASNIATAINAYGPFTNLLFATASSSITTITCSSSGTFCNAFTLTSSTPAALVTSSAVFRGGFDHAFITVNGITFTEGVNWVNGPDVTATAKNIAAIIQSSMTNVAVSTNIAGVIFATSTYPGLNAYAVTSSSPAALTWTTPLFSGGIASQFDGSNDQVNSSSHAFVTALGVLLSSTSATSAVPGLSAGTTYFVIVSTVGSGSFKLATSTTNAVAGTTIDISTIQVGGNTWALTPVALVNGFAGMKWQASNDNITWSDLSTVTYSSVTYTAAGSSIWDFQFYNYRYLRPAIVAPTSGANLWTIRIRGKLIDQ